MKRRFFISIVITVLIGAVLSFADPVFVTSGDEETGYGPPEAPTEFC